jgi:ATP-binding cassette subfamily B protein/subfamily B ATP-binding cassette protein MsbA
MKNYLRALRHAWPYRRRLAISVVCALLAAILWSLNLSSIYPLLKLLNTEQSLHQWVDEHITRGEDEVKFLQAEVARLQEIERELEKKDRNRFDEQRYRDVTSDLARRESKLETAHRSLWRYQVAKKWIYALLPTDCFRTLALVLILVVIGIALKCLFEFCQEWLVGSVVNLTLYDLRNRFYRNVIHLDVNQFSEQGTSELMSRFTNDTESLGSGIKTLFGRVVAEPLRAIACVVVGCLISWQLTLMFLILVPIAGLILARVSRIMKQATRRVLDRMSAIYKILQESFQGIKVVKAFTNEPYERRRFCQATRDYYHKSMKVVKIDALAGPIIEVLGVTAVALALLAGSYLVLSRQTHIWGMRLAAAPLEAESLLQLYILLAAIADPVRKLSSVFTRIQSGFAAADRIFEYLDRQPRVVNHPAASRLGRRQAESSEQRAESQSQTELSGSPLSALGSPLSRKPFIEFRDVCFSYDKPGPAILTNIHLTIHEGETVALVGHNGCGKTTLVNMIPRFFDPDHGSVLVEGRDLRTVHLRSLRQQIALVTQDAMLFDDTLYKNILYGNRGASREQIEEAARLARAEDFILKQPHGYETRLGEMAGRISGGQKQRVALARAVLRDPRILILDEFTSQTDAESEVQIHQALHDFRKGRTVLVITHRLNTLEIADRIVVLEQGRIVGVGTHVELLASCPQYQRLYEAHFKQRLCA